MEKAKKTFFVVAIAFGIISLTIFLSGCIPQLLPTSQDERLYREAVELEADGKYETAASIFEELASSGYKDSEEKAGKVKQKIEYKLFDEATSLATKGDYKGAYEIYLKLDSYSNSNENIPSTALYAKARVLQDSGKKKAASNIYKSMLTYKDSSSRWYKIMKKKAPKNAYVKSYVKSAKLCPLKIKLPKKAAKYYYILLRDVKKNKKILYTFGRGGKTINIRVPIGTYKILYASGDKWCGTKELFGPNGNTSKIKKKFKFYRKPGSYMGYRIELVNRIGGNLGISGANANEFR